MVKEKIYALTKREMTILIFLNMYGINNAKAISKKLEMDLSYTYKCLEALEFKGYVNKVISNKGTEYSAKEGYRI